MHDIATTLATTSNQFLANNYKITSSVIHRASNYFNIIQANWNNNKQPIQMGMVG